MCIEQDVLKFWFGDLDENGRPTEDKSALWWGKNEETDQLIGQQFGGLLSDIVAGGYSEWRESPQGLLATIIVLDQFSRNIFRDKPAAFAADPLALSYALQGIDAGLDQELLPIERVFFYLPLEHSEEMAMQELSIQSFQKLLDQVSENEKSAFQGYLGFAQRHYEVIARFGRYPHRNAILGRPDTEAEAEYLSQPGSGF